MSLQFSIPIIPIGVFYDVAKTLKMFELLMQHGMRCIEVTLRTAQALDCIAALKNTFPDAMIGAGSVITHDDFKAAVDAGAMFIVSPCVSDALIELSHKYKNIYYIPGFTTPTELAHALLMHVDVLKFFPAQHCGGVHYLKAIVEPFTKFSFSIIPTGGIQPAHIAEYLSVPKVVACGLSYLVDSYLIEHGDYINLEKRINEILACLPR